MGDGSGRNRTHIVSSNRPETSYIRTRIREDPATDSQVEKELYQLLFYLSLLLFVYHYYYLPIIIIIYLSLLLFYLSLLLFAYHYYYFTYHYYYLEYDRVITRSSGDHPVILFAYHYYYLSIIIIIYLSLLLFCLSLLLFAYHYYYLPIIIIIC